MTPTSEILHRSRHLLFTHAALWIPAFFTILLQDMLLPLSARDGHPGQALAGVCAAVGAVMISGGWVAMIGAGLKGEEPSIKAFADGVNDRWLPIVLGNLAFWLLVVAMAGAAFWYGHQAYGWDNLVAWIKPLIELPPDKQQAAIDPAKLPAPVLGWMNVVASWFAAFLLLNYLLLFWQPLVVLRGRTWARAWVESIGLAFSRFGQAFSLALLHLAGLFLARALMASLQPVATLVGVALYVGVVALFTIVYAAVVVDVLPDEPTGGPKPVIDVTA